MKALGCIPLDWKPFKVNMDKLVIAIKAIDSNCCGLSGDVNLRINGFEAFTPESETAIRALWDSITEGSELTIGYMTQDEIKAKTDAMRLALVDKPLADWTPADRKIWLGLPVTNEELV